MLILWSVRVHWGKGNIDQKLIIDFRLNYLQNITLSVYKTAWKDAHAYFEACQTSWGFFAKKYQHLKSAIFAKKVFSKIFNRVINRTKNSRIDQVKFVEDKFYLVHSCIACPKYVFGQSNRHMETKKR